MLVCTGILSHPQPSNSGYPLTHLVYPPTDRSTDELITVNYARYHTLYATAIITTVKTVLDRVDTQFTSSEMIDSRFRQRRNIFNPQ